MAGNVTDKQVKSLIKIGKPVRTSIVLGSIYESAKKVRAFGSFDIVSMESAS